MWTTNKNWAGTDGVVHIMFDGDSCVTDWHRLKHPVAEGFRKGAEDGFEFSDYDIGPQVN